MMTLLTTGVFGTSSKEQERRVLIHPEQLGWVEYLYWFLTRVPREVVHLQKFRCMRQPSELEGSRECNK